MLLRLEYQGKTLFEKSSEEISAPITIGRSSQATWQVPSEDEFLGRQHAEISVKGKKVVVRDLSKNGIFFQGERVQERRLAEGDRLQMSNVTLIAEKEVKKPRVVLKHKLTVRSGDKQGKAAALPDTGAVFTVGSDPKWADPAVGLQFFDPRISKQHAEFRVHPDGSCWVKELNSKNGTRVNGEVLAGGKERLLRCGDLISFAHIDVAYTDGTENRALRNVLIQGSIILASLVVLAAGYYIKLYLLDYRAPFYQEAAESQIRAEQFENAANILRKASAAPDYEKYQMVIRQRIADVQRYQAAYNGWALTRRALSSGDYLAASRELSPLLADETAWAWNDDGSHALAQAKVLKSVLDLNADFVALQADERATGEKYEAIHGQLSSLTNRLTSVAELDLSGLLQKVQEACARLSQAQSEHERFEKTVEKLVSPALDSVMLAGLAKSVETACHSGYRAVAERAQRICPAVKSLYRGYDQFDLLLTAFHEMDWDRVDAIHVTPEEAGEFMKDPVLSEARKRLAVREKSLRDCIRDVRARLLRITGQAYWPGGAQADLAALENTETLARVLACDTLALPFPRRTRAQPSGEFDRVLGLEFFQNSLEQLTTDLVVVTVTMDTPWKPVMSRLAELLPDAESLLNTMNAPDYKVFVGGRLSEVAQQLRGVLKRRDALREGLLEQVKQGERKGLVAGVLVGLMSDKGYRIGDATLRSTLEKIREQMDREVQALYAKRQNAALPEKIKLRTAILEKGTPAHRVVKEMWSLQTTARGSGAAQ